MSEELVVKGQQVQSDSEAESGAERVQSDSEAELGAEQVQSDTC